MKKIRERVSEVNREVRNKIAGYVTAGLGLVAGFAWNDAIRSSIEYFFPLEQNSLWAKFIYAVVITLGVVIVSLYLVSILKEKPEEK
ncbi:MAG: DUF5654 family protein [bacterium]|nr:DUF5654 family protein [bacterium]